MPRDIKGCRRSHGLGGDDHAFAGAGAERHYPPPLEIEPTHIHVELTFDLRRRVARGFTVTTIQGSAGGARELCLEARDLNGVSIRDEEGRELQSRYDGRQIRLAWEEPFQRGEVRRVRIDYSVEDPVSGLHFDGPDGGYPDRPRWVATDHETERARYWLPCVDHPTVRTTFSYVLTASADLTILAGGLQESEIDNGDGTKTARWRLDYPCPSYLACFAIGDLVRADDRRVGDREIAYFGARGRTSVEDLARSFGRTPEIMEWLESKLGPFPFPKYFQFALPAFGGAMENISLVSWDDGLVVDEVLAREMGDLVDIINVHEMAHSYFGDAIVIRDFAHAWLKESWATYMEACWNEDRLGQDEHRAGLLQDARDYFAEVDDRYSRPIVTNVYDSSWDLYDRHLYPGGAWRLHMLRGILGDGVFWEAVRDYVATYSRKVVDTDDFRKILEAHSGRSLGRFFDQWIHGRGYPKLSVEFDHAMKTKTGTFKLEQVQVEKGERKEGMEPFAFDLDIAWEESDGSWQRRTVAVTRRDHTFTVPMARPPLQVRIDPDGKILHSISMNPGDDLLRRSLTQAPDVVGRILAAEELCKTALPANLRAVAEACEREPFWGVRLAMARALARSGHGLVIDPLAAMMASEQDARVLRTVCDVAGGFRDERIAHALETLLESDPPYRVAAAALTSLGMQRGEAHLERLQKAATDTGYRSIVRSGALRGLAATRTERGMELLAARVGYGSEPDDAAVVVPEALAGLASHLDRRHHSAALDLLRESARDPRERVRRATARALGMLAMPEGAAVVESIVRTLPEQEQPRTVRIARGLRADGEKPPSARLAKRVEEVEDRCRKLEERLERVEAVGGKRRRARKT